MAKKKFIYFLIKFFSVIIAVILAAIPVFIGVVMYLNAPAPDTGRTVFNEEDGVRRREDGAYYVEIRKGESAQSVGYRMEKTGLIKSRYFWNLIGKFEKGFIKSGIYKLDFPMSQISMYRLFVSGAQTLHRVTIPEGVTIRKMARIYEYEDICSADEFIEAARDPLIIAEYNIPGNSLEGYLFPDTYFFPSRYKADAVVRSMLDNFFARLKILDPSSGEYSSKEIFEKVIIASIVEREYRVPEEAALMASVFYNRMKIRMGLQSCATVEYIITEILGRPHPGVITGADLEINNPYNTYKWASLPPGPISCPGTLALKAAFFPDDSDYFYFRLEDSGSGRHIFSRTNEEHIQAGRLITKPESR